MTTTTKLLSQRTLNCLARNDFWLQMTSIQRLASARADLNQLTPQTCKHLTRHYASLSRSSSTSPRNGRNDGDETSLSLTLSRREHQRQQLRLTSTTPPTASSISTPAKTTSPSSGQTTAAGGALKPSILRRDASTQAKHQQLLDVIHMSESQVQRNYQLRTDIGECEESFRAADLVTIPCTAAELKPKPSVDQLLFGQIFTDHMFQVEWNLDKGWSTPLITKIHNLDLHPGAKVLHYAVEAFEGVKAFRGHDNQIRFFRLDQNIKRLLRSSRRLALPDFDELELMKCIHKLVHLDQDWIPQSDGKQQQLTSLYIRPTIMGIEPSLGVANSRKSLLYVLLSPVGPYFKTGFRPVSLYADPSFVRAWPGGAGNAKLGSNYAPTIMVQKKAEKLGLQQVLWLYGDDMKLTEVGTMNIFVSIRNKDTGKVHLVTPPLSDGLVLPGITRASILDIARQWDDVICEERYVTIGELKQLIHENRLVEVFGAGTACVVCPVNAIQMSDGTRLNIPFRDVTEETVGADESQLFLTKRILNTITNIQYGRIPHPWAQKLNPH